MSHSTAYFLRSKTTTAYFLRSKTNSGKVLESAVKELKKQGYVLGSAIKKGMDIEIGYCTPEDGDRKKTVKVTKVKKVTDYHDSVQIEFDGCHHFDELPTLPLHWMYKVS